MPFSVLFCLRKMVRIILSELEDGDEGGCGDDKTKEINRLLYGEMYP